MINRRRFVSLTASSLTGLPAAARAQSMSRLTAYTFSFKSLEGGDIALSSFSGRPLLIVNTASRCGYTPQYAGLQTLWQRYSARGLMVLAVPSNDFGGQEPGGASDIDRTAHGEYKIAFPIAAKAVVKGADAHPFYRWAATERPGETPRWNFHKYLVGRDGYLRAAFGSAVEPNDPRVIAAIEQELAAT